ncbi:MAG: Uma2 family endonuclease [Leptolyngbya sp.]|nr:Uma2 family endonuclease [Leptolyngbya sp.]
MAETTGLAAPIIYPDTDGQPMTESDATRDYLLYCVEVLQLYFRGRSNVYVSGNLFVYYEEGNPKASISPDVFVIFGVSQRKRRSYKVWQEGGKLPNFVLEITSRSTKRQDEEEKPRLYASLGIQEYFQYDPTADYLNPQLRGSRLVDGTYQPLSLATTATGLPFIHSATLGLDLQLHPAYPELGLAPAAQALRFYDPQSGAKLLSRYELELLREALQEENETMQQERDAAQQERDAALQRAEELAARLRALGIDPDQG